MLKMVDSIASLCITLLLVAHQLQPSMSGKVIMAPNMSKSTCKCINEIRETHPEVRECVEDEGYLVRPTEVDLLGSCLPEEDREKLKKMAPGVSKKTCNCINAVREMNPEVRECVEDDGYQVKPEEVDVLGMCLPANEREKLKQPKPPAVSKKTCTCINAIREMNSEVRECVEEEGYAFQPTDIDLIGPCLSASDREKLKSKA